MLLFLEATSGLGSVLKAHKRHTCIVEIPRQEQALLVIKLPSFIGTATVIGFRASNIDSHSWFCITAAIQNCKTNPFPTKVMVYTSFEQHLLFIMSENPKENRKA
jgi:hypothetical protein